MASKKTSAKKSPAKKTPNAKANANATAAKKTVVAKAVKAEKPAKKKVVAVEKSAKVEKKAVKAAKKADKADKKLVAKAAKTEKKTEKKAAKVIAKAEKKATKAASAPKAKKASAPKAKKASASKTKAASSAKKPATSALAQELRALLEGKDGAAIHQKGVELFSSITEGTKGEAHLGLIALAFRRAGELGQAEAWVDFGRCLWNGWGVEEDQDAALAAYTQAADMGSDQGAYALAMNAYWHAQDYAAAQKWAKVALKGGDPVGAVHYLLGLMAFHGRGTKKDLKKSYALHEKAATSGDADAMFELFALASTGQGVKKDEAQAVVWLMEAAKRNHPRALFNLGSFHAMGSFGFAQDYGASADFYEAASEAGHGRASATLGAMYLGGQGVKRSEKKAQEFFARAEAQDFDVRAFLEELG